MAFSIPRLRGLANVEDPGSLSNRMRSRRFRVFESLTSAMPRPLRILDVGGTNLFWKNRGWSERADVAITTVNLASEQKQYANITPMAGDATDLSRFADRSFDICFSNSVIEHLFTFENQRKMACEVRRVSKAYWIQTPNFWFPMEPHFQVPGWQWLPVELRVSILRRCRCGWRGPCSEEVQARKLVTEVRLLTKRELQTIFPEAQIVPERFGGFVKSWVVVQGFPRGVRLN
ncbi:MAG: class I SAM-dependent methyltransferase [Terriglobales bacterium]